MQNLVLSKTLSVALLWISAGFFLLSIVTDCQLSYFRVYHITSNFVNEENNDNFSPRKQCEHLTNLHQPASSNKQKIKDGKLG
jgi:hypothetical protein